ncbi:hypothetical protein AMATHDRAFT_146599 [Amanita thiersii Skay4041]|uniref:G domain-containing protein n=1 Tax=Amanita thiersii Skay4041 TaxID=703135 RepID=A0A2A9NIH2_9AGAR|nr:hypothetical protein AMATHDRAFT_146599 [Amanita thiersii Skay4041]
MPALPSPPSWFPGHMRKFTRILPMLLKKTNVVLEIRDTRLPLTSINWELEGALRQWRLERGWDPNRPGCRIHNSVACEHIVVLNKRDLVAEWGMEPFQKAMASKFPDQRLLFASWHRSRDIRNLSELLVNISKQYPHAMEHNVLVVGMPNVGKSTLLNALRNSGIKGPTPKALRTSAQPGLTQALSTRLKISLEPLVYAFDSPGVMLPFLGQGTEGAERGVKLALIAGIKEGLYDMETLAAYLLYRLNVLNPIAPDDTAAPSQAVYPTNDLAEFLTLLARRMGMIKRGAEPDLERAAVHFVRWWREEGGLVSAADGDGGVVCKNRRTMLPGEEMVQGWGFDFEWGLSHEEMASEEYVRTPGVVVQRKMEGCIERFLEMREREEREGGVVSRTQMKKREVERVKARREEKRRERGGRG